MSTSTSLQTRLRHPIPLAVCVGLVLFYGLMSYSAAWNKSSTYDEPMHALGAWVHRHQGDYRINFEDPPLWQFWASLPNGKDALKVDWTNQFWVNMPNMIYLQWSFALDVLYRTPGNDGEAFVLRERFMMVLLAMGLVGVVAAWSWRLGGPIAAMIATAMAALDPNLLGHGALVKNDMPMGLMMAAVFMVCWRVGVKLTWLNGLGLAALVAAAVNVKFSALIFGPMLVILLGLRAVLPRPWEVLGRTLTTPLQKAVAVLGVLGAIGIFSWIAIWACYGFRYNPSPDPTVRLNTSLHKEETVMARYSVLFPQPQATSDPTLPFDQLMKLFTDQYNAFADADNQLRTVIAGATLSDPTRNKMMQQMRQNEQLSQAGQQIFRQGQNFVPPNLPAPQNRAADFDQVFTQTVYALEEIRLRMAGEEYKTRGFVYWAMVGDEAPDGFIRMLNFAMDYKLLPSAYLHGVLFVHARSIVRGSFLLGEGSSTGWWYYFPLAMLFKTPVATIFALLGATAMGLWLILQRGKAWQGYLWPLACLLIPFGIYMFSVMSANLNIGIRHVLCVYPLMYVAAGVLIARALGVWPWLVRMHVVVLGLVLMIESLVAWPDHVAYFNFASGGSRGGLKLLGDSNLDWGQDLPALKEWRATHMDAPLSLHYFGISELVALRNEKGETYGQASDWRTLPRFYGIPYDEPPVGQLGVDPDPGKMQGRYVAISATELQGVYNGDPLRAYRKLVPMTVLGGTIYIYDLRK